VIFREKPVAALSITFSMNLLVFAHIFTGHAHHT